MVRAVASRVAIRPRISKAMANEAAKETARLQDLAHRVDDVVDAKLLGAIPHRASDSLVSNNDLEFNDLSKASVALRPMGNSRRVFLLDPHLPAREMQGLAYRLQALQKSESINSVLIATDSQTDNSLQNNCLPRYITERRLVNLDGIPAWDDAAAQDDVWYVAGGYDPLAVDTSDPEQMEDLMESLKTLAMSVHGSNTTTKVPIITMPHGAVTDGGYALCMGSYMLATSSTTFSIRNPSRGLSLDPIGCSYILPRLGWEYKHMEARKYPGVGMMLALAGYECDAFDMVSTGLATHLASDSAGILPILEEDLATMPPWNQQGLVRKPKRFYSQVYNEGRPRSNDAYARPQQQRHPRDFNQAFRNVRIEYLMEQVSDLAAADAESSNAFPFDYAAFYEGMDASLDTDTSVPWDAGFFSSPLVDMAAALDDVFQQEKSLEGLIERLREVGGGATGEAALLTSDNADDVSVANVAQALVERMEAQSPLALRVTYQLVKKGRGRLVELESCMKDEAKAQRNLLAGKDFAAWQEHVRKHGGDEGTAPPFGGWQHKNVKAVTAEEVDAIMEGDSE